MKIFGVIGAAVLALLVATPAMAMQRAAHHRYASSLRHARNYRSFYGAYGFDRSSNFSGDFDRRNTFN